MKRMKNMTNQSGSDPGGSPKPDSRPPGEQPNESRATDARYRYKGGRQGSGGIPNPDDRDDLESVGSFRGTAVQDTGDKK